MENSGSVSIPNEPDDELQVVFFNDCGQCICPTHALFEDCSCHNPSVSLDNSSIIITNIVQNTTVYIMRHRTEQPSISCFSIEHRYEIIVSGTYMQLAY